jgi:carbamoyltransferase
VRADRRKTAAGADGEPFEARVRQVRSDIPAVTHLDYSARIHTVNACTNPPFHAILRHFEALTGCAVIVNTSFNVRGEPIVCTPEDAYRCFMRTEMDNLVLGPYVLEKQRQPPWDRAGDTADGVD